MEMIHFANMNTLLYITDLYAGSRIPELAGIREIALTNGYHVEEIELARLQQSVADVLDYWSPAGCILEGSSNTLPPTSTFGKLPLVYIDPDDRTLTARDVFAVENDDQAIAELAHRELRRAGTDHFAFVGWSRIIRWSRRREERFVEILADSGHSCHVLEDPWAFGNRNDFLKRLKPFVAGLPKPCGIFAVNDDTAIGVLNVCQKLSLAVPGDIFLIGVDDDPMICDNIRPSLSSIRPDFRKAGRIAADMLLKRIREPDAKPRRLQFAPIGITARLSTRRLPVVGKRIADVLDLIRREACSGLKAGDVVKAMGVTERLAETSFKRAVGRCITEEITSVRLERVLELLRNPKQAVTPIANICGWESDAYLKRLFKKRFGMTMREWRSREKADGI